MPRPGTRPYDCVRRAWHSDRHQPIRGTLIQEIFRVVNEIHGPATKKNKEYQEKLPVVVLRAEEIMYSKANSEAEYMDLTTLMERTNDAINTIIRRDETTETGDYLQPCIEAALNLGCSPKKASRGQRNSPRCYLSPRSQEIPSVAHNTIQEDAVGADHKTKSQYGSHCSNFVKTESLKSTNLGSECQRSVVRNDDPVPVTKSLPLVSENTSSTTKKQYLEHQPSSNLFSVYPLYYENHIQFDESQHGSKIQQKSVSGTSGPALMSATQNHLACKLNSSNQRSQSLKKADHPKNPCSVGCDLSLRLAPLSIPAPGLDNVQLQDTEERGKFSGNRAYVKLDCFSSKWGFKEECMNMQPTARKRKSDFTNPLKNQQLCLQP